MKVSTYLCFWDPRRIARGYSESTDSFNTKHPLSFAPEHRHRLITSRAEIDANEKVRNAQLMRPKVFKLSCS